MKKLKIYFDTSAIAYLDQQDSPDKMADTLKLWEDVKTGKYEVVISDITLFEIEQAPEIKRDTLFTFLQDIEYTGTKKGAEAQRICQLYLDIGGLPPKSRTDAEHIAVATVSGCNAVLSWNFKHIVNLRAMNAVDAVNIKEGYSPLRILSPSMLIESED